MLTGILTFWQDLKSNSTWTATTDTTTKPGQMLHTAGLF